MSLTLQQGVGDRDRDGAKRASWLILEGLWSFLHRIEMARAEERCLLQLFEQVVPGGQWLEVSIPRQSRGL